MSSPSVLVTATIDGRHVTRDQLLAWEDRRISVAARKLRLPEPEPAPTHVRREALVRAKIELGPDQVLMRVARDLRVADRTTRVASTLTRRRTFVRSEIHVAGGSAKAFVAWFRAAVARDDRAAMLRACPDHLLLRTLADCRQEVVQATGASPVVNRFLLRYDSSAGLLTERDPAFPHEIVAEATDPGGTALGGARMQFRDTAEGFHGVLCEELPILTPPWMVAQQRWHCATEFRNWAEEAFA